MFLTEIQPTHILDNCLTQIHKDIKRLGALTTKLKTKRQQLTQLFDRVSTALEVINELTALVPQTSTEIWAELEAIFQQEQSENCSISEAKPTQEEQQRTLSNPSLVEVAHQLLPLLKQGETITNPLVSRLMSETFGGSDSEGKWLWKDAYESLEVAQVMLIQQQGKQLLNKSDHFDALGEVERIHRLCLTQTRRSETSIQLQQFSTPLPLGYIASIAAQITPDDLVLEPSAGTGILASFSKASGAELLLNEICLKRRSLLSELFPGIPVSGFNAEQIDDYLPPEHRPTVVVMNPPFSASPKMTKRNQFATLKHLSSALARLSPGGRLVAITANWFSPLNHEWCDRFVKLQHWAKVVFSGGIEGHAYAKHGTTIETRLTVFDKIPSNNPGAFDNCFDTTFLLSDLLNYIKIFMPERQALTASPIAKSKGKALTERTSLAIAINHPSEKEIVDDVPIPPKTSQPAPQVKTPFDDVVELPYINRDWNGNNHEISDDLYEIYEPQTILIEGATEHPSSLVQSAAMASVAPPKPSYKPHLPQRLISGSILSSAQLESVIYAGESHSKFLKGNYQVDDTLNVVSAAPEDAQQAVQFRHGYFIGDSTGVGKGRQVSAIILDNFLQGRKKALWISNSKLQMNVAK